MVPVFIDLGVYEKSEALKNNYSNTNEFFDGGEILSIMEAHVKGVYRM